MVTYPPSRYTKGVCVFECSENKYTCTQANSTWYTFFPNHESFRQAILTFNTNHDDIIQDKEFRVTTARGCLSPGARDAGDWRHHQTGPVSQWGRVAVWGVQDRTRSEHFYGKRSCNPDFTGDRLTGFVHAEDHYWTQIGAIGFFAPGHEVYKSISLGDDE